MSNEKSVYQLLLESYDLCLRRDDFIWDKVVWIATLNHGIEVWQDDNREYFGGTNEKIEEPSAWVRLGNYIRDSQNDYIRKFQLRFRSHIITLPKSKTYYFTKGILGSLSSKINVHFANAGYLLDNGKIEVNWYKIPELIVTKTVTKNIEDISGLELIQGEPNFAGTRLNTNTIGSSNGKSGCVS